MILYTINDKGEMNVMTFEELKPYYDECFDENGNIKACGREACKRLLSFLGDAKYGDVRTGFINVVEVVALYNQLKGV